jgi:hypothetical protein
MSEHDKPSERISPEQPIEEQNTALKAAALDVVKRWHSPLWKWDEHTGVLIKRLADAAGIDINEL